MTVSEALEKHKEDCLSCRDKACKLNHECLQQKDIEVYEKFMAFEAIGTVEEFKKLKERNTAKKPSPIDYQKYIDVIENAKFLRGAYWCPNCKHTVRSGVYCDDCGQKLDWECEVRK